MQSKKAALLLDELPVIGEVQTGIPVPPRPGKQPSALRKAIAELEPGQSRVIKNVPRTSLYHHCKNLMKEFPESIWLTRTINEEQQIYRVWRTR